MSLSTVYLVVYAERFHHVVEGIFSTRMKAEVFLVKCREEAGEGPASNYEIEEWQLDELENAFLQYSAIAHWDQKLGEAVVKDFGEGRLTASLGEVEYLRYTDGSGAVIAYGLTPTEARRVAEAKAGELGHDFFTNPTAHLEVIAE